MVILNSQVITKTVKELFIEAAVEIPNDILKALEKAYNEETSELSKSVLSTILKNHEIAKAEGIPICQDTGMAVVFLEIGKDVAVKGMSIDEAVNEGVRQAYKDGYLRKSVVSDPLFDRENTLDNTPAIIYSEFTDGDKIKITVGAKGFGSENMSAIKMFTPSADKDSIKDFVVDTVKKAGSKPCPPVVVGVGIGGTFDKVAVLSKKALLRPIDKANEDKRYADLEEEILEEINKLGIGAGGVGGKATALGVNIETFPTHIAGLPVAVNVCCHVARSKERII